MVQHATKKHQEDTKHKTLRRSLHIRHVIYIDYIFVYSSTDCCLNPLLSLLKYFWMRQSTIQQTTIHKKELFKPRNRSKDVDTTAKTRQLSNQNDNMLTKLFWTFWPLRNPFLIITVSTVSINLEFLCASKNLKISLYTLFKKIGTYRFSYMKNFA